MAHCNDSNLNLEICSSSILSLENPANSNPAIVDNKIVVKKVS